MKLDIWTPRIVWCGMSEIYLELKMFAQFDFIVFSLP